MFPHFEDFFLTRFINPSESSYGMVISIRTNWIQRIAHSSHDILISVGERGNLNRTRRRLQGIDANIRRPCTPPFTSSYSPACRAIRCINSLPVSTIWIKKELIKTDSQAGNVTASIENLESISGFLHQYDFFPDRKYDHKLCTLIPSQPIIVQDNDHKLECNICLFDYRSGQKVRHLPCGHVFHRECIDRWLANAETCPKCRKHVVNALRLLLSRKEGPSTRKRSQSSVNLPSSSFSPSVHSNSVSTGQLQSIPSSVVVKHNRTSILRLELARNRRTTNAEFERATNLNSTPQAKPKLASNNPRQPPTHSGETPSASSSIVPSVGANEANSVCNGVLHSTNDKGDEMLNRESADEPRRKAAEAAMQRYEQFHKKTD